MNAEVTYDLYEEPSRWARALVIGSVIAVALLALWIFVPPFLARIVGQPAAPHHKDGKFAASAQLEQPVRTIPIDKSPRRFTAADVAPAETTSVVSVIAVQQSPSGASSPSSIEENVTASVAQIPETPTATTNPQTTVNAREAWISPPSSSSATPDSALETEGSVINPPRLPRARPHLTAAGTLPIPLPLPRPFIPTAEDSSAPPETPTPRPDYL
jgi:hypothetical protein